MTWSYNPSLLATSAKDAVRLLMGDVVSTDQQLQDEEINYLATTRGTVYGAAAECCRSLSAKFSRSVDQQGGTSKVFYSQLARAYLVKAIEFDYKAALMGAGMPYAGGISLSDKQIQDISADRMPAIFTKGMMDNTSPATSSGNETLEHLK